ncbi:aldolase catalytic domain-containing protein [Phocaeicola barnesiae]|uniref:Aldolase catalytic domain-containing protein n=1 Tax=Phocaeicola barnesiae TaxID=376804 RepID=A0AAW5N3K4_9BACT|nr:aldolase catalytic domain-containing protein [Phocaeicola barnesiae]MCR8872921.1 aldolase catalytic domain-containing protein [Phocaeicola barnesiae]
MKNIKILDCTLRDGGRIINCAFPDMEIRQLAIGLADANIDIIEVGFLRDWHNVKYEGNSTFFTDVEQIIPFLDKTKKNMYVAFVDYGMFDFDSLKPYDGRSIDGIRVGFSKKDYDSQFIEIKKCLAEVKNKGYKLFVQGVNSLSYSDKELLDLVDSVNEIHPDGFGIVDTYGAMYIDDVDRIYSLVDHNLNEDIAIDFHSHNNYQLSFAFAQEIIKLSHSKRQIIIDATLNGMGKCAGNLNTELIVDFLVRKMNYTYNLDAILDLIDNHIYNYQLEHKWGYSIPALMGGIYKSHPNNIIYLTEKFRLATKDIKYIISMMDSSKRTRYDYDYIKLMYNEYNHTKVDDKEVLNVLKQKLSKKKILLLLPGISILENIEKIKKKVIEENLIVIFVNFYEQYFEGAETWLFFGSEKRYTEFRETYSGKNVIVTSNVKNISNNDLVVNYDSCIDREEEYSDNTMLMLLKLLRRLDIIQFYIAGFDGYSNNKNYYDSSKFSEKRFVEKYDEINNQLTKLLKRYVCTLEDTHNIQFLTPSIYSHLFK